VIAALKGPIGVALTREMGATVANVLGDVDQLALAREWGYRETGFSVFDLVLPVLKELYNVCITVYDVRGVDFVGPRLYQLHGSYTLQPLAGPVGCHTFI